MKASKNLNVYDVNHQAFGRITVVARAEEEAIVKAAERWKTRWTAYGFYAYCEVVYIGMYRAV